MELKKRAFARLEWERVKRTAAQVALAAVGMGIAAGSAGAATETGCQAVNDGALKVELATESRVTRDVALKAGDRLTFNFQAAEGPFGAPALRTGMGAPRALLVGPSGTSAAFVAPRSGAFGFEFTKEGAEPATFSVSCAPPEPSVRSETASVAAHSEKRLGIRLSAAETFEAADLAGVILELEAPAAIGVNRGPLWAGASPKDVKAPAPAGGVDMHMQWRGESYRTIGPDGLEIDNSASGVEAAFKYKPVPEIMVGALAQVDQAGETLVGPPRSLSDQGWMAGPVTNIKLGSGLTLDARAAWGLTESATDELSSHATGIPRRLVSARLANTQAFGLWRLTPSVSVNHAYAVAPAVDASVTPYTGGFGRVDVGPELAYRIELGKSAFLEPKASVGTFWDFDTLSKLAPGAGHTDLRLKAEAGVTIGAAGGAKLQAGGGVEEGESGASNVWSGRLRLNVPMQ